MAKDILIVIDVQNCFLSGGGLSAPSSESERAFKTRFTNEIHGLIQTGKFQDVYFTQDIHHPNNVSMKNQYNLTKNGSKYKNERLTNSSDLILASIYNGEFKNRRWVEKNALKQQVLWPRHCIIPHDAKNPYYPADINRSKPYNTNKIANEANLLKSPGSNGIDLGGELHQYTTGLMTPGVNTYHVYKGFNKNADSYSAIANAYGEFEPFIAMTNGKFNESASMDDKFAHKLINEMQEGLIANVYICGIARDYCVKWTALDLLDLVIFNDANNILNENKPAVKYIFDLTKQIGTTTTKETLMEDAQKIPGALNKFNVINKSDIIVNPTITGGRRNRRNRNRSTRRNRNGNRNKCSKCNTNHASNKCCGRNHRHTKKCRR